MRVQLIVAIIASGFVAYCEGDCEKSTNMKWTNPKCDTSKFQDEILAAHNDVRAKVKAGTWAGKNNVKLTKAKVMPALVWDTNLAKSAEVWADRCVFEHGGNKQIAGFTDVTPTAIYVGENLYYSGSSAKMTALNGPDAVKAWADETKYTNFSEYDKFTNKPSPAIDEKGNPSQIGHFTQIIWGSTTKVGCAGTCYTGPYKDSKGVTSNWFFQLIVCHYAPGGNIIDQKIYEK